jgi:molybdopterin-containing oxidoreductase family iron-sulfur binding subunit
VPGQADGTITVALGYGREKVGRVGNGVGANVYALRTTDAMDFCSGVEVSKTGKTMLVASTQYYGYMDGRTIVIEGTLAEYQQKPDFVESHLTKYPPSKLYESPYKFDEGHQWGMTIDLNACIGCNACVVACQSENNVPVVGKEQTAKGRHMHWIRIDRYFSGEGDMPEIVYQPVACQHCENAPCEQVCPVAATVHDPEGLNTMVYNRCIGTRYCANNCPYKVRRFNYFNYQNDNVVWNREIPEITKMAMNPEVTVRSRGVMEKCTYCVQRIHTTKIMAKNEGRDVVDGEIMTACQQACPTQAIVFGDIRDPNSQVAQMKAQNRNYALLGELNVKPRTTYLAKLRNPNPELEEQKA